MSASALLSSEEPAPVIEPAAQDVPDTVEGMLIDQGEGSDEKEETKVGSNEPPTEAVDVNEGETKHEEVDSEVVSRKEDADTPETDGEGDANMEGEGTPDKLPKETPAAPVEVDPAVLAAQQEEDRKRRREVLDSMVSIEAEFSALKDRLFSEKIRATQREVDMVKNETHDEFLTQVRKLKHIREQKIAAAERWMRYQTQTITEMFDAEKRTVNYEFEAEKGVLRDRLLVALSDKRRKLEEEKHTLNLTDNDVGTESRALKRSLRRRDRDANEGGAYVRAYGGDGLPPPQALGMSASVTAGPSLGLGGESGGASLRRVNKPPHVSYALKEQEVLEDLAQINTDLGSRRERDVRDIDVHTDRGYLFYGDQVFERGMTVDIEGPTNSAGRGIIWSITDNEITIRFPDDKRGTIYTSLLRAGKYILHEV